MEVTENLFNLDPFKTSEAHYSNTSNVISTNGPVLHLFTSDLYLVEKSMVDPEEGPRVSPLFVEKKIRLDKTD